MWRKEILGRRHANTVPSSLSCILHKMSFCCGIPVSLLEMLLHPIVLILTSSLQSRAWRPAVRAQLPGKLWCCLVWNADLRFSLCFLLVLWRSVCTPGAKGSVWQVGPSLGTFCSIFHPFAMKMQYMSFWFLNKRSGLSGTAQLFLITPTLC